MNLPLYTNINIIIPQLNYLVSKDLPKSFMNIKLRTIKTHYNILRG